MFFEQFGTPLQIAMVLASLLLLVALGLALFRIATGPSPFDRLVALDLIGGLCLCAIVLFAISFGQKVLLDAAFAIAVVSFIGTVALARFLGKGGRQ